MTALGRKQMEEWKDKKQRVRVCSQGGEKEEGRMEYLCVFSLTKNTKI